MEVELYLFFNLVVTLGECLTQRRARFTLVKHTQSFRLLHYLRLSLSLSLQLCVSVCVGGLGSSVGIATDYGLDGPGSKPGGDEIFRPSRPALWTTQPPVKWVPFLSRGLSVAEACC